MLPEIAIIFAHASILQFFSVDHAFDHSTSELKKLDQDRTSSLSINRLKIFYTTAMSARRSSRKTSELTFTVLIM